MHPLVRRGALGAALALFALAAVQPGLAPATVRGGGSLPDCRYDDLMTAPRAYSDWAITLVDTILRVPRSYVPPDLVSVSKAGVAGSGKVRAILIDDLHAMSEAADAAGNGIGVHSAYRSYDDQKAVFDGWVQEFGYARALEVSARPGHSEHQLGLAIDFRSDPGGSPFTGSWGKTPAGTWMNAHAWEFGFMRSYPPRKQSVTCYDNEAWHYRYVGRDLAAAIHASGLTLREYLWANFTTAVVPATAPGSSADPTEPASSPAASAGAEPSDEPPATPDASLEPGPPESPGPRESPAGSAWVSPTPFANLPAIDPSPVADLDPAIATGIAAVLGTVLVVTVMVLRRGRSGVGL